MAWTYIRQSAKLVKVMRDGAFAGWLEVSTRRTTGLHSERVATWCGKIDGREVKASSVAAAKAKIEACGEFDQRESCLLAAHLLKDAQ